MPAILTDLPAALLEEVLQRAEQPAIAAARRVGRECSSAITAATPSVTLRLSSASTPESVARWARATRRLAHARVVVVPVHGGVNGAAFDAAMALLGARRAVRSLKLLRGGAGGGGVGGAHNTAASVPSLASLRFLAGSLESLDVDGVVVRNDAATALAELAPLAPSLKHLGLSGWRCTAATDAEEDASAGAAAAVPSFAALTRLTSLRVDAPPPPPLRTAAWRDGGRRAAAAAAALQQLLLGDDDDDDDDALPPRLEQLEVTSINDDTGGLSALGAALLERAPRCLTRLALSTTSGNRLEWAAARHNEEPALVAAAAVLRLGGDGGDDRLARAFDDALARAGLAGTHRVLRRLRLSLPPSLVPSLGALLVRLPALEDLSLTALSTSGAPADLLVLAAAVAASAPRVTSLALAPGLGVLRGGGAADALAPLFDAPGAQRHLLQLRVVARFGQDDDVGDGAWSRLACLGRLRRLAVTNLSGGRDGGGVRLPAGCLPRGLEALNLRGVRLVGGGSDDGAATPPPPLASVRLVDCAVERGALLRCSMAASVADLALARCRVDSGWPALAAAWPRVEALRVCCSDGGGVGSPPLLTLDGTQPQLEQLLSLWWPRLRRVELQQLPRLDAGGLAALLRRGACLRSLTVSCRAAASEDELVAAAAVEALGDGGSGAAFGCLRALCLQLPVAGAAAPAALNGDDDDDGGGGGGGGAAGGSHGAPPTSLQRMAATWSVQRAQAAAAVGAEAERCLLRALPWAGVRVVLNQAPAAAAAQAAAADV